MEARMCFEVMGWRILVFYPEWYWGIKFTNILPKLIIRDVQLKHANTILLLRMLYQYDWLSRRKSICDWLSRRYILIRSCVLTNKLQTSFPREFMYSYRTMVHNKHKNDRIFFTYILLKTTTIYGLWLLKFNVFRWRRLQLTLMTLTHMVTDLFYDFVSILLVQSC